MFVRGQYGFQSLLNAVWCPSLCSPIFHSCRDVSHCVELRYQQMMIFICQAPQKFRMREEKIDKIDKREDGKERKQRKEENH